MQRKEQYFVFQSQYTDWLEGKSLRAPRAGIYTRGYGFGSSELVVSDTELNPDSKNSEDFWQGEYLLPTIPIGPWSISYTIYWWYTRVVKLWDSIFGKELIDFGKGLLVRYKNQTWTYLMSWQLFNFTVSTIEDGLIKTWSRVIENLVSTQIRLRHRTFDFFSNLSYVFVGMDLHGRWYREDFITRWNQIGPIMTMLWNKEDLNMSVLEYWMNKVKIQSLVPNGAVWNRFEMFRIWYNKSYEPSEMIRRLKIFVDNLDVIYNLNKNERGTAIYGVTPYADMSVEEFAKKFGAYDATQDDRFGHVNDEIRPITDYVPENFDWRYIHPIVTRVKDYRDCSASWAYSVVENVETLFAIKTGHQMQFSDQQVIDCDVKSMGCNGGSVASAYEYIHKAGLTGATNYSFRGYQGECKYEPSMSYLRIHKGFNFIMQDEAKIRNYLYTYGPVTARVNIAQLQFYKKGIIRCIPKICDPNKQNHVVNLYGYGLQTKQGGIPITPMPYWIAKNFWGRMWGEEGFFRLYRGENTMGVRNFPTAPTLF